MTTIFISYRREDSGGWSGRLSGELREAFGEENVFFDLGIDPGDDYVKAIEQRLDSTDVTLVVIGPQWLTMTTPSGQRRLDDPGDLTRTEVAKALALNKRVIPVLVGKATMPAVHQLPKDLGALALRQAYEISDTRWALSRETPAIAPHSKMHHGEER